MIHEAVDILHEWAAGIEQSGDIAVEQTTSFVLRELRDEGLGNTLRVTNFEYIEIS